MNICDKLFITELHTLKSLFKPALDHYWPVLGRWVRNLLVVTPFRIMHLLLSYLRSCHRKYSNLISCCRWRGNVAIGACLRGFPTRISRLYARAVRRGRMEAILEFIGIFSVAELNVRHNYWNFSHNVYEHEWMVVSLAAPNLVGGYFYSPLRKKEWKTLPWTTDQTYLYIRKMGTHYMRACFHSMQRFKLVLCVVFGKRARILKLRCDRFARK